MKNWKVRLIGFVMVAAVIDIIIRIYELIKAIV